jgi:hypothetical protein
MQATTVVIVIVALFLGLEAASAGADGISTNAVTRTLLAAKKAKGLSWGDLGKTLGLSETWAASLFYRQATVPPPFLRRSKRPPLTTTL